MCLELIYNPVNLSQAAHASQLGFCKYPFCSGIYLFPPSRLPCFNWPNSSLIPIWNHNWSNEEKGAIEKKPLCLLHIEVTLAFSFFLFPRSCNILGKLKLSSFQSHTTITLPRGMCLHGFSNLDAKNKQTNKKTTTKKGQENRWIFSTSFFLQSLDLAV